MADFRKLCKRSQAAKAVSHPSTPVVEGREGLTHLSLNSVNEECPHGAIGNKPAISY
jgi:hypothetical protein